MAAARSRPPADRHPIGMFEWLRLLRRVQIPWNVKSFGVLLMTYADPDGTRVRPGVKRLAAVTGLGQTTVKDLMGELVGYGLLEQTRRGGGRGGTGRASEYRLTIPVDLLDRFEMLTPDEEPALRDTLVVLQSDSSPVDNSESETAQGDSQSDPEPVDNSTLEDIPGRLSIVGGEAPEDPIESRNPAIESRLCGDYYHPHHQPPKDDPAFTDPAQPQTARTDGSQEDHVEGGEVAAAEPPPKCPHNLPRRHRPDGQSTCAFCRRDAAQSAAQPPDDAATPRTALAESEHAREGPKRPRKPSPPSRRKPRRPRRPT